MADIARPALAEVLAAITTRPVGHWRAEVSTPAFVGVERISPRGVQWTVRLDPYRATTQTRHASLRQTEPAYEARRVGNTLTRVEVAPAHTITPAEAVEALATVGLWPWEPGDERAPRWWCERCEGVGFIPGRGAARRCAACLDTSCVRCGGRGFTVRGAAASGWDADAVLCAQCNGRPPIGHAADPPSHAALVAVASLGRPLLLRITHALAPEIARAAGCPDARVVWRVMGREAISRHFGGRGVTPSNAPSDTITVVQAREERPPTSNVPGFWRAPWPVECPYSGAFGTPDDDHHGVHAAWPALRTLAVGDGETPQPTGVHLVALDASRIVLAVEAIGGPRG